MPIIENTQHFELPLNVEAILQKMFQGYERVLLKKDFVGVGYSGSLVYRIHLIKDKTPELPVVVKVASVSLIQKEWLAYERCVKNQWPGIAQVRGEPVILGELAALCYSFVGGGVFGPISLYEYCLKYELKHIRFVLEERLFRIMKERMLLLAQVSFEYSLRACYDMVLPVNLLIDIHSEASNALSESSLEKEQSWKEAGNQIDSQTSARELDSPIVIRPDTLPALPPPLGTLVHVEGLVVTKVNVDKKTVTLDQPNPSYRVRLRLADLGTYQIGQILPPMQGVVIETRQSVLENELAKLGLEVGEEVTLSDGCMLPNPLLAIEPIFRQTGHLKFNYIHGDLNFENVLVDPQVRDVRLIDFASARNGYVLHDFLRLETEVLIKLIRHALIEANLPAQTIFEFYQQLHCATFHPHGTHKPVHQSLQKSFAILTMIREAARDGFFNQNDFSEYYQGLTLYLVGALKFSSVDVLGKQVAFLGAATIQQLLVDPPKCEGCQEIEPLATIIKVNAKVKVIRAGSEKVQPAMFGMQLQRGDVVMTLEKGEAEIFCKSGLLCRLPERSNLTIECRSNMWCQSQLKPELKHIFAQAFNSILTLIPTSWPWKRPPQIGTRSGQAKPILLKPRNTVIDELRPTFYWQPVENARGYLVTIIFPDGEGWQGYTTETHLRYPDDAPALKAHEQANMVTVTTLSHPYTPNQSWLRVMDKSTLDELNQAKAALQTLTVDQSAKSYLLAQLYQQYQLYSAAIAELEQLTEAQDNISVNLWQQLGHLYAEVGLYPQAEKSYQAVLASLEAIVHQEVQATAYVGLAHVAYILENTDQSLDYLSRAEALYREVEDLERANQIAIQKSQVSKAS